VSDHNPWPNPRGVMGAPLSVEEIVGLLWRIAPAGSKVSVMPLRLWVLAPGGSGVVLGGSGGRGRVLVARHRLPDDLRALCDADPEAFTRRLGVLAYGDPDAFTPE
jgi:hypothetical protein